MAKFKSSIKDGELIIKSKLEKSEVINQGDFQIFGTKLIRGLMRPLIESERKIKYSAPNGIPLSQYLSAGITVNDYFVIVVQAIETIKKIENYMLNIDNLVTDVNYVYINPLTKEVNFIYQPVFKSGEQGNIFVLMHGIASCMSLRPEENPNSVNAFMVFLSQRRFFYCTEVENQIQQIYPMVYKQIHKQAGGKSQAFGGTSANPYDTSGGMGAWKNGNIETYNTRDYDKGANSYYHPSADYGENEDTGLLYEEEGTAMLNEEDDYENSATTLLMEEAAPHPYIIRRNTGERAEINKDIFKIGKEKRYVDFFVTNNTNVSRVHMDIITRGGQYYAKDNHSTNKTYVNGNLIPAETEVPIHNMDILKLANEEFEFHVE